MSHFGNPLRVGGWGTTFRRMIMLRTFLALSLIVSTQTLFAEALVPAYSALGTGNTASGFTIPVKINSPAIAAMTEVYVTVQYAPLASSTQLVTGPMVKVPVGVIPGVASFFAVDVKGLKETTMYRALVNVYRADGVHLAQSTPYYTTTTGNDPKSIVRTRMVLKGLMEFYESEQGFVGQGGTKFVDGTKYGADVGEAWCSEFYSWVATGSLKGIEGIGHFKDLVEYFRVGGGFYNSSAIPTIARRGDYLAMDTDDTQGINHSGMFLAYEKLADGQQFVWTLEGNSGKKVRVNRRPLNHVFMALGHIVHSQI